MPQLTPWPPADPVTTIACTIWMEARGDGQEGMHAVANVIMNRARNPRWWGHDIVSVCLAPWQFSSFDPGSTQIPLVKEAIVNGDPDYLTALKIAEWAVEGILADITDSADSYFAVTIPPPYWSKRAEFTVQIGRQKFYRTELPPLVDA